MRKPVQISIPEPCHENWQQMTPADQGRFCASCQKNVHDFTRSSDREIAKVLQQEDDVCGRFLPSQLERDLLVPKEKSPTWAAAAAVLSLMSLGTAELAAQTPANIEQQSNNNEMLGKIAMPAKTITGTITDMMGPIPGAIITIDGSKINVLTDFDGNYTIEVWPGYKLIFSYPGYKTQERTVDAKTAVINIVLNEEEMLGEVVVTGYRTTRASALTGAVTVIETRTITKERTFFGRIFHSIGNLFR